MTRETPRPALAHGATGHVDLQSLLLRIAPLAGQQSFQFSVSRARAGHINLPP
jgi:hypothetical protein